MHLLLALSASSRPSFLAHKRAHNRLASLAWRPSTAVSTTINLSGTGDFTGLAHGSRLSIGFCKASSGHTGMSNTGNIDAAYFWMPDDVPYGGFSHWSQAQMRDAQGHLFLTVEHYMMYHKALLFDDTAAAQAILSLQTPAEAKAAGRRVQGFDKQKWSAHCQHIVFDGNFLKFLQHEQLKKLLLDTGGKALVEASPEDSLWGIGFSAADAPDNKEKWGQNLCGKAIEKVRAQLQEHKQV